MIEPTYIVAYRKQFFDQYVHQNNIDPATVRYVGDIQQIIGIHPKKVILLDTPYYHCSQQEVQRMQRVLEIVCGRGTADFTTVSF